MTEQTINQCVWLADTNVNQLKSKVNDFLRQNPGSSVAGVYVVNGTHFNVVQYPEVKEEKQEKKPVRRRSTKSKTSAKKEGGGQ